MRYCVYMKIRALVYEMVSDAPYKIREEYTENFFRSGRNRAESGRNMSGFRMH